VSQDGGTGVPAVSGASCVASAPPSRWHQGKPMLLSFLEGAQRPKDPTGERALGPRGILRPSCLGWRSMAQPTLDRGRWGCIHAQGWHVRVLHRHRSLARRSVSLPGSGFLVDERAGERRDRAGDRTKRTIDRTKRAPIDAKEQSIGQEEQSFEHKENFVAQKEQFVATKEYFWSTIEHFVATKVLLARPMHRSPRSKRRSLRPTVVSLRSMKPHAPRAVDRGRWVSIHARGSDRREPSAVTASSRSACRCA
jgi:hypothetical protein